MSSKIKSMERTGNKPSLNLGWSKREKIRLLKGLKKYGHTNIVNISNMIGTRSREDVEMMISKLIVKSEEAVKDAQPLLNDWLGCDSLKKSRNTTALVQQALLFIHLFEKRSISASRRYDYRAIYHFLYKLFCGCEKPELSKENEKILYGLLSEIVEEVTDVPQRDFLINLGKILNKKTDIRTYPGQKKSD